MPVRPVLSPLWSASARLDLSEPAFTRAQLGLPLRRPAGCAPPLRTSTPRPRTAKDGTNGQQLATTAPGAVATARVSTDHLVPVNEDPDDDNGAGVREES